MNIQSRSDTHYWVYSQRTKANKSKQEKSDERSAFVNKAHTAYGASSKTSAAIFSLTFFEVILGHEKTFYRRTCIR